MTAPRKLPERLIEPPPFVIERGFQSLMRRRNAHRKSVLQRQRLIAAAAVAACLLLGFMHVAPPELPAPVRLGAQTTLRSFGEAQTQALADGSILTLAPRAELTTLGVTARRVSTRLDRGQITFDLEPALHKRWDIDATFAQVEAVDARFSVERDDGGVRVQVLRGAVLVYAAELSGGHLRVTEGQTVRVPTERTKNAPPPRPSVTPLPASPRATVAVPSGKKPLALPVRTPEAQNPSADALLAAADAAREARDPTRATAALAHFVDAYPADRRVGMAAFTLGKLALEHEADPARAARSFRLALARGVPAMLAEDASARLVEALSKSGDRGAALEARDRYRAQYSAGRYLREVQGWAP